MEAVPTPYDILPPPGIAYIPTLWVWIITLCLAVLLAFITWSIMQLANRRRTLKLNPVTETLKLIDRIATATAVGKAELTTLVLAIRRCLSTTEQLDLTTLTASELQNTGLLLNSKVKEILKLTFALDELTFRARPDLKLAQQLILEIKTQLANYSRPDPIG